MPTVITPDMYVSDIAVQITLPLRDLLVRAFPGRLHGRRRDLPLSTVPGHTVFVPAGGNCSVESIAAEILPILVRDVHEQLAARGLDLHSNWGIAYTWDGHGLFQDGPFVFEGFRFEAAVEVTTTTPGLCCDSGRWCTREEGR